MWESMKIASLCDTYDVNCAAHNFCGHLGTAISAHFLASIPNLRVLEYQHEQPAWAAELFTSVPTLVRKRFSRAIMFLALLSFWLENLSLDLPRQARDTYLELRETRRRCMRRLMGSWTLQRFADALAGGSR